VSPSSKMSEEKLLAEYRACKESLAHAWKMLEIANKRLRAAGLPPVNGPREAP
jgi:hypothetical protein